MNRRVPSLFGLYDMFLGDATYLELLERSARTLAVHLGDYDARYWSYCDLVRRIASPAHHKLHIAQMGELVAITGMGEFADFAEHPCDCEASGLNRVLVVAGKESDTVIV